MINVNIEKQIFFNKFKLLKLIDKSEINCIYKGINIINKEIVLIKIEKKITMNKILESEAYILYYLKGFGIPNLISYGKSGKYNILVEEFLGPSLYEIFQIKNIKKGFPIKDVCMIALQGLDRLEYIHSKNIIHRDLKTQNFLIGRKDEKIIYLIDFGLAKKYKSSRTGKFIKFTNLRRIFGSLAFSSINANSGYEQSRRDDLESFGYVLIYLAKSYLPWLTAGKIKNKKERLIEACKLKNSTKLEEICEGIPEEFIDYIKYCRKLEFEQDPNYDFLRNLFVLILTKENQKNDLNFFWINKVNAKSATKNYENNYILKRGTHKRLYNSLKKSLEKNKNHSINSILKSDNSISNNSLYKTNNIPKKKNEKQKINLINENPDRKSLINKPKISIKNYKTNIIIGKKNFISPSIEQKYNYSLKNQKLNKFIKKYAFNCNLKNQTEKVKIKNKLNISDNVGPINISNYYKNDKMNITSKIYHNLENSINNKKQSNNFTLQHNNNYNISKFYHNLENSIAHKKQNNNLILKNNNNFNITKFYRDLENSINNKKQNNNLTLKNNNNFNNSYFNYNGNQIPTNNSNSNLIPDIHYRKIFKI